MFSKIYYNGNIIAHKKRISDYLYFCTYLLNLKKIRFNKSVDYNFSKLLILDQEMIELFISRIDENLKLYKELDYLIFIWNSEPDYQRYKQAIDKLELKINKRVTLYVSGNNFLIKNRDIIKFNKFYKNNNIPQIKGIPIDIYLFFKYPMLKSILLTLLYPHLFLLNFFKKKIYFIGFGKFKDLNFFSLYKKNNFITSQGYGVIKNFFYLSNKNLEIKKIFFFNLIKNKEFIKLKSYERYLILQCIFRYIFISIMEKFKYFKYFENDGGLSLNTSPIYNKNYSLDFGSRMGSDKYYQRYIILSRIYKKNMLVLRFFSKEKNNSHQYFKNNMLKMYFFLENLSNIKNYDYDADKLKYIILKLLNKKIQI